MGIVAQDIVVVLMEKIRVWQVSVEIIGQLNLWSLLVMSYATAV